MICNNLHIADKHNIILLPNYAFLVFYYLDYTVEKSLRKYPVKICPMALMACQRTSFCNYHKTNTRGFIGHRDFRKLHHKINSYTVSSNIIIPEYTLVCYHVYSLDDAYLVGCIHSFDLFGV